MADLAQLMEIAPLTAAGFVGQNQAMSQRTDEAKLQELAQLIQSRQGQEQRAQAMHPLELEAKRLGNQNTAAGIPGTVATSRKLGVDADIAEATKGSAIEAKDIENKMKTYKAVGSHLGSLSSAIEDNPNLPPHLAFAQALDGLDIPPKNKQALLRRYANVPAPDLQRRLVEDGDKLLRETEAYAQHFDTTSLTTSAMLVNGAEERASRERIADADRAAGKFDRKGSGKGEFNEGQIWAKRVADARSAKERHSAALGAIEFAKRNDDPKAEGYYQAIADAAEAQARAEIAATSPKPGEVDVNAVTGGAVPTNPNLPIRGAQNRPTGTPQGPQSIEAMVKAQGGTYDPSRFEYRINPQTGKVQSRPK